MFDDPQINAQPSQPVVAKDQTQASAAAPATPATPSNPPAAPASSPASDVQTNAGPQPSQANNSQQVVSNAGAAGPIAKRGTQDTNLTTVVDASQHPLVQKAGVMNSVARALAGNPTRLVIDADGSTRREPVPLSGKQIAMAIALEAITGSLAGLAGGRGRGAGAAGATAFAQSRALVQQRQQQLDEDATREFENRSKVLAQKAQIAEVNSRTILNTAESEKYGADAIDRQVEINRTSGVLDVDPDILDNGGQPMTQDEMLDAIKAGRLSTMDHLGPVAGRVEVVNPDGSRRWEATHIIVKDPNSPVTITQDMWDRFAAAHVPGFPAVKIGTELRLKLSTVQRANEIMAAHGLAGYRLKEMRDTLNGTSWADQVPASVDFSKPGVDTAIQRFQKYVSHSNQHGMDVYESLQSMGADRRDPKTGAMQPNPDAKYVDQVAQALGGWPVLEAVHNQLAANKKAAEEFNIIDSESKANAVLASTGRFTKDQVTSARNFLALAQQQGARKAAQEARERAVAEGKDVEAMLKTGINPITGERLTLANAPDSMLVDAKGRVIPQNQQPLYKPDAQEKQTADTARQVLSISAGLRAAVTKNPNLVGPLLGNSKSGLAKLGLGDAEAQKMLDDVAFLQSAATKMHTGRFSNEILKKMSSLIKPGMNTGQFTGALNSIDEVAGRYAQEDKLVTVADYREMQQSSINAAVRGNASQPALTNLQVNPATGQQIGWDGKRWVDVTTRQPVK